MDVMVDTSPLGSVVSCERVAIPPPRVMVEVRPSTTVVYSCPWSAARTLFLRVRTTEAGTMMIWWGRRSARVSSCGGGAGEARLGTDREEDDEAEQAHEEEETLATVPRGGRLRRVAGRLVPARGRRLQGRRGVSAVERTGAERRGRTAEGEIPTPGVDMLLLKLEVAKGERSGRRGRVEETERRGEPGERADRSVRLSCPTGARCARAATCQVARKADELIVSRSGEQPGGGAVGKSPAATCAGHVAPREPVFRDLDIV